MPRNRRTVPYKAPVTAGAGWDKDARFIPYKGITIEVFPMSALARALNRDIITLRAMERKGIICRPSLKERHGQVVYRIYTRDQIEDMITLAADEGVLAPASTKHYTDTFKHQAREILRRKPQVTYE